MFSLPQRYSVEEYLELHIKDVGLTLDDIEFDNSMIIVTDNSKTYVVFTCDGKEINVIENLKNHSMKLIYYKGGGVSIPIPH